jgi:hypothetical protein
VSNFCNGIMIYGVTYIRCFETKRLIQLFMRIAFIHIELLKENFIFFFILSVSKLFLAKLLYAANMNFATDEVLVSKKNSLC